MAKVLPDKIDWEKFKELGQIGIEEIALKKRA